VSDVRAGRTDRRLCAVRWCSIAERYVRRGRDVLGLFANVGQLSLVVDGFGSGSWGPRSTRALFLSRRSRQQGRGFGVLRSKSETRSDLRRLSNGLTVRPLAFANRSACARTCRSGAIIASRLCTIAGFYR
jgi:hypothetical protein